MQSPSNLLILEDDADRANRFRHVALEVGFMDSAVQVWRNAHEMANSIRERIETTAVISLDHDLFLPDGTSDAWGDGMIVANTLASLKPFAPVILHSSNRVAAHAMMGILADAGWHVERVAPIGDRWVEEDWAVTIRSLLLLH